MRIHFERAGGFTGMRIEADIDTAALPPEDARELATLIEAVHFFDLPPRFTSSTPGADQFEYTIMVESEERHHTVHTTDAGAPPDLRPLLQRLTRLARSQRG